MAIIKKRQVDLIGQRFGKLIVIEKGKINIHYKRTWICRCDCGKTTKATTTSTLRGKHSQSCGCDRTINMRLTARRKALKSPPYTSIYNILTGRAEKRGIDCTLTYDEFVEFTKIKNCYYCGDDIKWVSHHTSTETPSRTNINRKNSLLGYTKDNCAVCCYQCNVMKNNLSSDQFVERITKILPWQKRI